MAWPLIIAAVASAVKQQQDASRANRQQANAAAGAANRSTSSTNFQPTANKFAAPKDFSGSLATQTGIGSAPQFRTAGASLQPAVIGGPGQSATARDSVLRGLGIQPSTDAKQWDADVPQGSQVPVNQTRTFGLGLQNQDRAMGLGGRPMGPPPNDRMMMNVGQTRPLTQADIQTGPPQQQGQGVNWGGVQQGIGYGQQVAGQIQQQQAARNAANQSMMAANRQQSTTAYQPTAQRFGDLWKRYQGGY